MDVLHTLGRASVAEVVEQLDDPPSYNSVRVTLSILERKGVVQHAREGASSPRTRRSSARDPPTR